MEKGHVVKDSIQRLFPIMMCWAQYFYFALVRNSLIQMSFFKQMEGVLCTNHLLLLLHRYMSSVTVQ